MVRHTLQILQHLSVSDNFGTILNSTSIHSSLFLTLSTFTDYEDLCNVNKINMTTKPIYVSKQGFFWLHKEHKFQ